MEKTPEEVGYFGFPEVFDAPKDVEAGKHGHDDSKDGSREGTDSPSSGERKSSEDSGGSHKSSPEGLLSGGKKVKRDDLDSVNTTLFEKDGVSSSSQHATVPAIVTTTNPLHKNGTDKKPLSGAVDSNDDV
jgi:hypothetical protein